MLGSLENVTYFALLKHPLLGSLSTELLDILKHVEYDVLHMHCRSKRNTQTNKFKQVKKTNLGQQMGAKSELALLLTETLLCQVHVDDEEHEPTGSFLLPSNKCVDPALKTHPE